MSRKSIVKSVSSAEMAANDQEQQRRTDGGDECELVMVAPTDSKAWMSHSVSGGPCADKRGLRTGNGVTEREASVAVESDAATTTPPTPTGVTAAGETAIKRGGANRVLFARTESESSSARLEEKVRHFMEDGASSSRGGSEVRSLLSRDR